MYFYIILLYSQKNVSWFPQKNIDNINRMMSNDAKNSSLPLQE